MKLQPQSLSVFSEVVQSTHWEVEVPVSLVLCKENLWVKLTDEMVAAFNRPDWTIETIESGGSPLINHVEELGRMIMRAGQVE